MDITVYCKEIKKFECICDLFQSYDWSMIIASLLLEAWAPWNQNASCADCEFVKQLMRQELSTTVRAFSPPLPNALNAYHTWKWMNGSALGARELLIKAGYNFRWDKLMKYLSENHEMSTTLTDQCGSNILKCRDEIRRTSWLFVNSLSDLVRLLTIKAGLGLVRPLVSELSWSWWYVIFALCGPKYV